MAVTEVYYRSIECDRCQDRTTENLIGNTSPSGFRLVILDKGVEESFGKTTDSVTGMEVPFQRDTRILCPDCVKFVLDEIDNYRHGDEYQESEA